jgi:hypothetical protein
MWTQRIVDFLHIVSARLSTKCHLARSWELNYSQLLYYISGVNKFFKTLASLTNFWRVFFPNFNSQRHETTGPKYRKGPWKGKKHLAMLANGFIFLLAKPEFYSHLASCEWLSAPLIIYFQDFMPACFAYVFCMCQMWPGSSSGKALASRSWGQRFKSEPWHVPWRFSWGNIMNFLNVG